MRILLINNDTKRLDELKLLLQSHEVTETTPTLISDGLTKQNDLIILTGSHKMSVIGNDTFFKREIELIQNTDKPVLGICLGLQIISYAYGGWIDRMPVKHQGVKHIQVVGHDLMFDGRESFKVYASHRWMVDKIDHPLVGLARSADGWEIVKHANKKIYGFQFHPEVFEGDCSDGKWLFERVIQVFDEK